MNIDRQILLEKLKQKNAFWSYKEPDRINDELLIEQVLLLLDLDEINILFRLFKKDFIKRVWEENILKQEPYYHGLNRFFAWFYFSIENPDEYIKSIKSN